MPPTNLKAPVSIKPIPQPELPGLGASDGSAQLDIASHELAELESRLANEGRFIATLEVRQRGYTATIQ